MAFSVRGSSWMQGQISRYDVLVWLPAAPMWALLIFEVRHKLGYVSPCIALLGTSAALGWLMRGRRLAWSLPALVAPLLLILVLAVAIYLDYYFG